MQTSVPVAPQIQAASLVPQPALSQPAGADWAPSGQPQFDAAMAMAMAMRHRQVRQRNQPSNWRLRCRPPHQFPPHRRPRRRRHCRCHRQIQPPHRCHPRARPPRPPHEGTRRSNVNGPRRQCHRQRSICPPCRQSRACLQAPTTPADPCIPPAGVPVARSHAAPPENAAAVVKSAGGLQAASDRARASRSPNPPFQMDRRRGTRASLMPLPTFRRIQSPSPVATQLAPALLPASTPAPAAASSTPVSASPRPAVASPADQVAPVLVSMAHAADGAQRMTLRLEPPDLGHVEIRIDRTADAPAHVNITVERPETLILMLRDQPQLQRALDQAGVPPDGRSVTFHIATAEPGARSDAGQLPADRRIGCGRWRQRLARRIPPGGRSGAPGVCRRRGYRSRFLTGCAASLGARRARHHRLTRKGTIR